MNFEQAYKNYKEGNATEEEKLFVEQEIEKAKQVAALLEKETPAEAEVNQAEMSKVKQAKKRHTKLSVLKTACISTLAVILIVGLIIGIIFGIAAINAGTNAVLDVNEAKTMAIAKATELHPEGGAYYVDDVDRELDMTLKLSRCSYVYYIEISNLNYELEIAVNSHSKEVRVISAERND